eukprot:g7350.t1
MGLFRVQLGLSTVCDVDVPSERCGLSPYIDTLLEEDPESFYNVTIDGEVVTLQHEEARIQLDNDRRDFLNLLVNDSALEKDDQVSNLAFFKTHKTGSTTLAILLHRYGRRHNLQVAHFPGYGSTIPIAEAANKTRESRNLVDIMHYHIDTKTTKQERWAQAKGLYSEIMRDRDNINFITIFREPRERLLSFYSFFFEYKTKVPIKKFFQQENPDPKVVEQLRNLGCKEFGIETEADLDEFILAEIPQFELILLTERFDEGLMVMRNLLKWHLVDVTYVPVNKTFGRLGRTATGAIKGRSHFENLPEDVQRTIDELTVLDKRLYDAGVAAFEKKREAIASKVETDLEQFEKLQIVVKEVLRTHPSDPVHDLYRYKTAVYYEQPPAMASF